MKTTIVTIVIGACIFLNTHILFGQPGLPSQPEQAPIDGGLLILAAAGGGYALKKLRDRNRSE